MAVTIRDAVTTAGSATTTSFTIVLPTTVAGDILVLEFTHRGTGDGVLSGTSITTGGLTWTLKHDQHYAGATFSGKTYWARATGDHAGQTIGAGSLTNSCAAVLTVYAGALAAGDPLADATVVGEENASGNETQAQITTTTNGAWVVLVVANSPDVAVTTPACTSPGALTVQIERLSTGGTDTSIAHCSAEKATAGATGAFTWAQTNGASGSWAYAIQPEPVANRAAVVSWAEFEVPNGQRRARVTWAEMEIPTAPRRARVTWAELEVPNASRKAVVSWAELEVPAITNDRRAIVVWAELEVPVRQLRALITWAEMEVPDAPRRAIVTWAELALEETAGGGDGITVAGNISQISSLYL